MNIVFGAVGGASGALVGAAIWATVGHFTGYEVGWIAVGVGALSGFGVSLPTHRQAGMVGGIIATVMAVGAIGLGRYAEAYLDFRRFLSSDDAEISMVADVIVAEYELQGKPILWPRDADDAETIGESYPPRIWKHAVERWNAMSAERQDEIRETPRLVNPEFVIAYIADDIVFDWQAKGKTLEWPQGKESDSAWFEPDYPQEVWAEAKRRWDEMSPQEQSEYEDTVRDVLLAEWIIFLPQIQRDAVNWGFIHMFSPYDALWIVLAVGAAYKLGAGGSRNEVEPSAVDD